jgi:hypothetical protein
MATRKSPARGTGSRPAKATTTIGKPRAAAKKSVKVSAKPAAAQPAPEADSNIVQLPPAEATPVTAEPVTAEKPAEPAPIAEEAAIEEITAKTETAAAPPASIDEPEPYEELIPLKDHAERMAATAETEAEVEDTAAEEEAADEPEVEMTFKSNAFSGASLFPGFPQFANLPEFPAFGAVDMNAFVASGTAMVEGMQSIGNELMAFSRQTAERNVETTMAMLGASSVQEAIELQSRHTTGSINDLMAEGTKLSGMAIDVANKAASSFSRS